jgi:ATP-dependent Clp protease ATP-binding subunit ClpC
MIQQLKQVGLSLSQIKDVMDKQDVAYMQSLIREQVARMRREMTELELALSTARGLVSTCDTYLSKPQCYDITLEYIPRRRVLYYGVTPYVVQKQWVENPGLSNWEKSLRENRETVDEEQIANVVSMISGIPVQKMAQAEGIRLMGMKDDLMSKVIGQDKAIETLVKAIRRSRIGLKDPNRPIGTFMFLGPTGVGKTHLAKELAKFMFGSADALIRVDMSEYMEKFTVSRLVGAPPGYVGYEEGGLLTEKVRRKPYSIVLLDEIEKAHSDVFNILLQVLDEGHLTDTNGRTVDFKNTIVIMTSNVGTRQLKDFGKGIGFNSGQATNLKDHSQGIITKALNKQFAPEFLNRLDEIINFDQLEMDSLVKIVDIELEGLYKRVEAIGYKLVMENESRQFIAKKGYDIQYGARPLKRAIQNHVEDALAEVILGGNIEEGNTIRGTYDSEKDAIVMVIEK